MSARATENPKEIKPMHPVTRFVSICVVAFILALSLFLLWVSKNHAVPVIMYHSINYSDTKDSSVVSPESFERQMSYLHKNGYNVISLDDYVTSVGKNRILPRNTVVLTFDDGYEDNDRFAYKILQKYNFPATIFMSSDYIGKEGFLTLDQLKKMKESELIEVGSHTRSHAYLPDIDSQKQQEEIIESKRILENLLEIEVRYIAYPGGGFSERIKRFVKDAGYKGACSTNRGYDKTNRDVFELKRIKVTNEDVGNGIVLWLKYSGYYNTLRTPKNPY